MLSDRKQLGAPKENANHARCGCSVPAMMEMAAPERSGALRVYFACRDSSHACARPGALGWTVSEGRDRRRVRPSLDRRPASRVHVSKIMRPRLRRAVGLLSFALLPVAIRANDLSSFLSSADLANFLSLPASLTTAHARHINKRALCRI